MSPLYNDSSVPYVVLKRLSELALLHCIGETNRAFIVVAMPLLPAKTKEAYSGKCFTNLDEALAYFNTLAEECLQ